MEYYYLVFWENEAKYSILPSDHIRPSDKFTRENVAEKLQEGDEALEKYRSKEYPCLILRVSGERDYLKTLRVTKDGVVVLPGHVLPKHVKLATLKKLRKEKRGDNEKKSKSVKDMEAAAMANTFIDAAAISVDPIENPPAPLKTESCTKQTPGKMTDTPKQKGSSIRASKKLGKRDTPSDNFCSIEEPTNAKGSQHKSANKSEAPHAISVKPISAEKSQAIRTTENPASKSSCNGGCSTCCVQLEKLAPLLKLCPKLTVQFLSDLNSASKFLNGFMTLQNEDGFNEYVNEMPGHTLPTWQLPGPNKIELMPHSGVWILQTDLEQAKLKALCFKKNPENELMRQLIWRLLGEDFLLQTNGAATSIANDLLSTCASFCNRTYKKNKSQSDYGRCLNLAIKYRKTVAEGTVPTTGEKNFDCDDQEETTSQQSAESCDEPRQKKSRIEKSGCQTVKVRGRKMTDKVNQKCDKNQSNNSNLSSETSTTDNDNEEQQKENLTRMNSDTQKEVNRKIYQPVHVARLEGPLKPKNMTNCIESDPYTLFHSDDDSHLIDFTGKFDDENEFILNEGQY